MGLTISMLFYAYYGLQQQITELQTLIAAYRLRVDILDSVIHKPPTNFFDFDGEEIKSMFDDSFYECDNVSSFLLLNRDLSYLKDCTYRFFKAQQLDGLLSHIDHTVWEMYSGLSLEQKVNNNVKRKKSSSRTNVRSRLLQYRNERASLQWPIQSNKFWLSSLYGPRRKRDGSIGFHYGIDMAAIKGTPVMAAGSGTVLQAHYAGGWGNAVVIKHANHLMTRYAHLHEVLVRPGQKVFAGMIIGKVGETGYIRKKTNDGSHLHFELYQYNTRINPLRLLPPMS